jgi:hypothetical protein
VRRIVAAEYFSLDGVMEDPGPAGEYEHRGWTVPYWNDDIAKWQTDQLFTSDALLLGRVTYDEFVASWPLRSGDPFSDRMNRLPKFVASTMLQEPLVIYPLVLGTGKRFFKAGNTKNTLELKRAETSSTGVTMLVCEPAA